MACDAPLRQCLEWHIKPHLDNPEFYKGDLTKGFDDGYSARCPAHDDRHRSFTVNVGKHRIWYQCHAGCDQLAVRAELIAKGVPDRCLPITQQRKADLVDQLTALLTNPDLDHGHKVLLALAHIRGMGSLPRGAGLEGLARETGVSRSRAFDYRRLEGGDPTSGRYGAKDKPVKHHRSDRSVAPGEKSDGRTLSDGRTPKSPMVGLARTEKTGDEAA